MFLSIIIFLETAMNTPVSLDGAQAIFTYAFKDPRWKMKFLIGTLLGFAGYIVPILPGLFLLGYSATIMRQIIVDNADASLPEWDDWGTLFKRGLRLFGNMIIFMLPVIIFALGGYALMMLPMFGNIFSQSRSGIPSSDLDPSSFFGMVAGMGLFVLGMLLSLPISLLLPPALAHGVARDSFAAAFNVREWGKILRANLGGFFTAFVLIAGVYFILIFALQMIYMTIIFCFLLPFLLSFLMMYMSVVSAAAIGAAYRRGAQNINPPPVAREQEPLSDPI
jgi:hypothetical protein